MEDKRIQLKVQGISNRLTRAGVYALILSEEGNRQIPIVIGSFEIQSIAIAIDKLVTSRPLTHDLFVNMAKGTGYTIKEVYIHKFTEGVFFSEIVMTNKENTVRIDSRTSDAIAIALRAGCPIYTRESIVKKCSIIMEDKDIIDNEPETLPEEITEEYFRDITKLKKMLRVLDDKDIKKRMKKAVDKEDYEIAKLYKDELIRREENKN